MNKNVKGSLAAAAAAVLLLGGAGSLAFWNDSQTVAGTTINAGELKLDAASCSAAGWTVSNSVEGVSSVGITAGASVPEVLVREVLDLLTEYGFGPAEEVVTAEEDILFSLPKELRSKLKEAGDSSRGLGGHGGP